MFVSKSALFEPKGRFIFCVATASICRRVEVHAVSREIVFSRKSLSANSAVSSDLSTEMQTRRRLFWFDCCWQIGGDSLD